MNNICKAKRKNEWCGYLFTLPLILGVVFFFLSPLVFSLRMSFGDIDGRGTILFTGWDNLIRAFTEDAEFTRLLIESTISMLTNVPIILVLSFLVANLLKSHFPGRTAYRMIFFLPVVLMSGIMVSLGADDVVQAVMHEGRTAVSGAGEGGWHIDVSSLLLNAGLPPRISGYLSYAVNTIFQTISASGIQILLFLAALQSISPALYEASAIEGATAWENFWKITFPMVTPQILVAIFYTVIDSFIHPENALMKYIYAKGFNNFQFGYSAALSWVYFIVIALMLAFFYFLTRRMIYHYDK